MVYKAALFDLDATLVYTMPEHRYTLIGQVLQMPDVSPIKKYIDMFWFETNRSDVVREHFKVEPAVFWERFRKFDTVELRRKFTAPYDDTAFLHELKRHDIKTGIVTGAHPDIADLEIGLLSFDFDAKIIAHTINGVKPKPFPHGIEECLNRLSVDKEDAVYVGNAEEDILSAKSAGVFDILIERRDYHFHNVNASLRIKSLFELRPYFGFS